MRGDIDGLCEIFSKKRSRLKPVSGAAFHSFSERTGVSIIIRNISSVHFFVLLSGSGKRCTAQKRHSRTNNGIEYKERAMKKLLLIVELLRAMGGFCTNQFSTQPYQSAWAADNRRKTESRAGCRSIHGATKAASI